MTNPEKLNQDSQPEGPKISEYVAPERVKKTDHELIAEWKEKGLGQQDSSVMYAVEVFHENAKLLRKVVKNPNLYDIGGGRHGMLADLDIIGCDVGIKHATLVEPNAQEDDIYEREGEKERYKNKFDFVRKDGLSFLLNKNTAPANIMVCSLDVDVVGSYGYIERLAQEIYKKVPEDGIFVCVNSPEIEKLADRLFAFRQQTGSALIFSKRELMGESKETIVSEITNIIAEIDSVFSSEEYQKFKANADTSRAFLISSIYGGMGLLKKYLQDLSDIINQGEGRGDEKTSRKTILMWLNSGVFHQRGTRYGEDFSGCPDEKVRSIWQRAKKLIDDNF